jgi:hypothetical protein
VIALNLLMGFTLACSSPPGTVITVLSTTGGDGNPVSYQLGGTAPIVSDLMIKGTTLVVGPSGIAPAHCGSKGDVTVQATQK